jgi:hypothetical protein
MKAVNFSPRVYRWRLSRAITCAVCFVALVGTTHTQERRPESQNVDDLIESIKQGTFTPATVNRIVQLRAVQAIPVLKQQFAANADTLMKQALASGLVRLGDTEDVYWNFLVDHAKAAIESDAPFPSAFDTEGKLVRGQLSPEFVAWAKAHNMSPESASSVQAYALPVDLTFLAVTGDARGLPLLKRGLSSRNYFIQAVAAKGLAKLRDTNSVPEIIAACKNAPAQAAELIARALVFFDDPRAQSAAETFITNQRVLGELRKLSREKGPDGVF